jgi:hypothetical protein
MEVRERLACAKSGGAAALKLNHWKGDLMPQDQTSTGQIGVTGFSALLGQVMDIGRTAQAIAGEMTRLSADNIEITARTAEKLRAAKSLQDVTSIQTDMIKESFEKTQGHVRKIAEIAAATPAHVVDNYREFVATISDAGRETARRAADVTQQAGEVATSGAGTNRKNKGLSANP